MKANPVCPWAEIALVVVVALGWVLFGDGGA